MMREKQCFYTPSKLKDNVFFMSFLLVGISLSCVILSIDIPAKFFSSEYLTSTDTENT